MAAEDKQALLNALNKNLYDKLTGKDVDTVTKELLSVLTVFDVKQREPTDKTTDTEELLKAFLDAKRAEGKSENTIEHYRYLIKRLMDATNASVNEVTVYHLRSYLTSEKERGMGDKTLQGYRWVYSSFFGWLFKEALISRNPCANLGPVKCRKEKKKAFSETDLEKIREACYSLRDKALVNFLLSTGCRVGEVCGLNIEDLDFSTMEVHVLGKGNKERVVYMDFVTVLHLRKYLESRKDNNPALFVSERKSTRLTDGGIQESMRKLGRRADVEKVYPHRFRHTFATILAQRGMPIQEISVLMGHEDISTTMKYIGISQASIKSNLRKYA